jgi:IS5 family transposase
MPDSLLWRTVIPLPQAHGTGAIMKPRQQVKGQEDLFRSRLDQIIDMRHELVRLGGVVDWRLLDHKLGEVYADGPGQPPLPTRLMAAASILKHTFDLSDEELVRRWVENPYFQHFCGMEHFCHVAPFDPSSLSRWRTRMGAERLEVLLQESLAAAVKTDAVDVKDLSKVIVDTTVQEKAVTFPTDARLANRARQKLVKLAKKHGLTLRQGYPRVGKLALMKYQRYAHARQFKRARRELRRLKTYLRRVIRDIERKLKKAPELEPLFRPMLFLAQRVHDQQRGQRGRKVYSLHAPEVECIGKGKAHKPYEFGVKVSIATTVAPSAGGQFVLAAKALPGAPYDGHTLATVIPHIEAIVGNEVKRVIADKGYRGHGLPAPYDMRVYVSEQRRGVTPAIKRELKRRSAVEPVIGHLKSDHRMDRNFLLGTEGDAANAVLAAVGYNFARLLAWLRQLWRALLTSLAAIVMPLTTATA